MLVLNTQLVVSVKFWYQISWVVCLDLHTYQFRSSTGCLILQNVLFCQLQLLQRFAKYGISQNRALEKQESDVSTTEKERCMR